MEFLFDREGIEVGIDEAGRGCLSGKVFVGAVIMPYDFGDDETYLEIKDSKKISKKKRKVLREWIEKNAIAYNVAWADEKEIDKVNILQATMNAMHRALDGIDIEFNRILVDGNRFKTFVTNDGFINHNCIIKGDDKYIQIAAASILAKTHHDEYIEKMCKDIPELNEYDLLNNQGYGTKQHRLAIKEKGLSKYHRRSFKINIDNI